MARTLACLLILAFPLNTFAQGKLGQVRDEVNKSKPDDSGSKDDKSSSDDSSSTSSTNTDEDENPFAVVFLYIASTPWSMPYLLLDRGAEGKFTRHPYASADTPHIAINNPNLPWAERSIYYDRTDTQHCSIRAAGELGSDFDGLTRAGVRLYLDTDTRFGLKSDWDYFHERLPCGCEDTLGLGDLTATFRFVQSEHIQMHTGLGARVLLDHGRDRGGFNFLYGFDAFPIQPVHLFGSFEAGTLGNAGLWRLHGGVGVHWSFAELFAGYDYLRIGNATLQGTFVGLRLWF